MADVDLIQLQAELRAAGESDNVILLDGIVKVPHEGDDYVVTYVDPTDPGMIAVINAHVPTPKAIDYAVRGDIDALGETTNATPKEIYRFTCEIRHLYRANLRVAAVDLATFDAAVAEHHFVWKRASGGAVLLGDDVVSEGGDSVAGPAGGLSAVASGNDIVFMVTGVAGRTIDWLVAGTIGQYAPEGID